LAVIDQHAADERYRLERLIEQLRYTSKVVDPAINIPMSERHLHTLLKRREVLLQWGIEITIEKSGVESESEMPGIVELPTSERQGTLKEMGVLLLRVIPEITKDLDAAKWKQILLQYLSEEKSQLPSLLTQILASKACRSVPPRLPVKQSRLMIGGDVWRCSFQRAVR
jgi:DNA mismatch repair ATPase MutL